MKKNELAELAGLTRQTIRNYETGDVHPTDEHVAALAKILRFPVAFFSLPHSPDQLSEDAPTFRALSTMTSGERDAALATAEIAFDLDDFIRARFTLPEPELPNLFGEDPEIAASSLRAAWGLGERPIKNMIHLLEAKGVRVYSLAADTRRLDAFALWRGEVPYVFINTLKSAEHARFDAAHELGHLVLHRERMPKDVEMEREANRFASAFLMPAATVISRAPRSPSVHRLCELKAAWGVSVAALAVRLKDLDLYSAPWQYRSMMVELSRLGWRTTEPNPIAREGSQVFDKVFSSLRADGTTLADVSSDIKLLPDDVGEYLFGLTVVQIRGGGQTSAPRATNLRLV